MHRLSSDPRSGWSWREFAAIFAFAAAYLATCELSFFLSADSGHFVTFQPQCGVYLVGLLLNSNRRWPLYVATGFVADVASDVLMRGTGLPTAVGLAAASSLETVIAATVFRWVRGRTTRLAATDDVLALVAGIAAGTAVGAVVGAEVMSLAVGADYWTAWRMWWLADLVGGLVAGPLILAWRGWRPRVTPRRLAEAVVLAVGLTALTAVIFRGGVKFLSFPSLVLPLLLWTGARFEFRGVTLAVAGFAVVTFAHTAAGSGPLARPERTLAMDVYVAQALVGIFTVVFLALAAVTAERRRATAALTEANAELEARVRGRTADLNRQTELLRTTLASIGDAVLATDAAGRVTFLNPVAAQLTGWPGREATGRPLADVFRIVNEKTREPVESPVDRVLRDGAVVGLANHTVLIARDGGQTAIEDSAAPIREGGELSGVVMVFRDVTVQRRAEDALRASEARFRDMADAAPAMLWVTEPGGACTFLSRGWSEFTGQAPADGLGAGWLNAVHPADRAGVERRFRAAIAAREPFTLDYRVRRAAGGDRWVIGAGHPWFGPGDVFLGYIGSVIDITDRKAAEERLRLLSDLGEATRDLDEPAAVMGVATRLLGRHLGASRCAYADLEPDRFTVRAEYTDGCTSVVGEHPRGALGPAALAALSDGKTLVVRDVGRDMADSPAARDRHAAADVRATVICPLVKGGRLSAMLAVHQTTPRDWTADEVALIEAVTERCRAYVERAAADRAVREGERRLRITLDAGGMGTWDADVATGACRVDAAAAALFGHPSGTAEMPEWSLFDHVHPDDRSAIRARIEEALAKAGDFQTEFRVARPDETEAWLAGQGRVQRDAEGRPVRIMGVNYDVTRQKQTEAALREADRRKDEFLATLAHELRNPLAPIRNALQILALSGDKPEAVAGLRGVMTRQVGHMVRLIDDLLDLSRVTRGMITLRAEPLDAADAVRSAVETSRPALDAARHELRVDLPAGPVPVTGDLTRLTQIVANLLNNAAKYTPAGGHVAVSLARESSEAVVRVTDDGLGIPADQQGFVWDLFAQVNRRLDRSHGGLGIGLALVKRLVELHHGTVGVVSDGPGLGSTFTVRLPLRASAITDRSAADDSPTPHAARQAPAAGCRVLVVDDNRDSADSLAELVEAMGHEVRVAYDGPSGLAAATGFAPAVALLDIGMAGMDGLELATRLRGTPDGQSAVLVAQTGWGQEEDRRKSRAAGFDHHLTKPIEPGALRAIFASLNGT